MKGQQLELVTNLGVQSFDLIIHVSLLGRAKLKKIHMPALRKVFHPGIWQNIQIVNMRELGRPLRIVYFAAYSTGIKYARSPRTVIFYDLLRLLLIISSPLSSSRRPTDLLVKITESIKQLLQHETILLTALCAMYVRNNTTSTSAE
jgi:thiamine phosphate synthase YjbQ (UPF0047 family)